MIFLTLGTQKFQFDRILEYLDEKFENKELQEEIFAQIGNSNYTPKNYKYKKFLDKEEFEKYISSSSLIISHGGVGSIVSALKHEKKIIVVPRLSKYKEHVDDHQLEIAEAFAKRNFVISNGENINNLLENIRNARSMVFEKYESSNKKIQNIIEEYIEDNEKNKKINVLMIGSDYKTVKGGIASVIKNYVEYQNWNEVKLKFIPTHRDGNKVFKILYFLLGIMRIDCNLIFKKYDVTHIHVSERGSISRKNIIIKHIKMLSPKSKIVLHHHGAEFDTEYEKMSSEKKEVVNNMLKTVDVNIVLSNRLVNSIKGKQSNASVQVLYNSVNTYDKNKYNNGNIVLFLGRLGKRKGTYDFIDVLAEIRNDLIKQKIEVYLCGDGEIEEVKSEVNELKLNDIVKHIGWISSDGKNEIFENTLINVLPSYNEGLPMTILETMAYGIPNISTNIASIPEVIKNGETGLLIQPGDKNELKKQILYLLKNNETRNKLSENSYNLIKQNFSLDKNIELLTKIYFDILNK